MGTLFDFIVNAYRYLFGSDWKGWLKDEVKEHANTINKLNQKQNQCDS